MPDLRYNRIGYAAVDVTNLERAVRFHQETIGLDVNAGATEKAGNATLLRGSAVHSELALYEAPEPGLRRVAFEMSSESDLQRAHGHLTSIGVKVWDVSAGDRAAFGQHASFRFAEPNTGLTIELYVPDGLPIAPLSGSTRLTNISQLGHVVMHAIDPVPVGEFFARELNFRVSDYIGPSVFMRCFPNPYHHSFAISRADENRLNHVAFLVDSLDDLGRAIYRLKEQNVEVVFGPGRHPPSGSVFLYFLDPDGLTFEFTTGMEEFPEAGPRAPRVLPAIPESYDYWGSPRSVRMAKVGLVRPETAAAEVAGIATRR